MNRRKFWWNLFRNFGNFLNEKVFIRNFATRSINRLNFLFQIEAFTFSIKPNTEKICFFLRIDKRKKLGALFRCNQHQAVCLGVQSTNMSHFFDSENFSHFPNNIKTRHSDWFIDQIKHIIRVQNNSHALACQKIAASVPISILSNQNFQNLSKVAQQYFFVR